MGYIVEAELYDCESLVSVRFYLSWNFGQASYYCLHDAGHVRRSPSRIHDWVRYDLDHLLHHTIPRCNCRSARLVHCLDFKHQDLYLDEQPSLTFPFTCEDGCSQLASLSYAIVVPVDSRSFNKRRTIFTAFNHIRICNEHDSV